MTRVAALYDVHGNLPALQAVLDEVATASVDVVIFGGDLCWGPMPRETLELICQVPNARFVRGNADRSVAARGEPGAEEWVLEITRWAHDQLEPAQRDFLASQPTDQVVDVQSCGEVLFVHGSPRGDEETITTATPDDRLEAMLAEVTQNIVVFGHTHTQFERELGGRRLINAGSVGLPFGDAGAYWAILGPDIELRRTDYDCERAAQMFLEKDGAGAEGFAKHTLKPPPFATASELWG